MNTIKNKSTNLCSVLNERYDQGFNTNEQQQSFQTLGGTAHEYSTTMLGDNTGN